MMINEPIMIMHERVLHDEISRARLYILQTVRGRRLSAFIIQIKKLTSRTPSPKNGSQEARSRLDRQPSTGLVFQVI